MPSKAQTKQLSPTDLMLSRSEYGRFCGPGACLGCREPWQEQIRDLFEKATTKRKYWSENELIELLQECGFPGSRCAVRRHLLSHETQVYRTWKRRHEPDA
jgi:hypothetical protein